ncbi:MAG: ATP-binding cassette domain-containing protein [Gammaproteobacteria bacterium]|nr:ATP-binding cassette domain-containing protein [Gammaproteobacteria bacterium]
MIELIDVHKRFDDHIAVESANLLIQQNEIVGIIGRSGAGKSTLLRCMNLLERPDKGDVKIEGVSLLTLSPRALRESRHKIGMIFQHFNLLSSKTVYENIALPLRIQRVEESKIKARVDELLLLVELKSKADAYPSMLSGGQKQRVAIARALATQPHILLCDEATSALDPETTLAILMLLKKINQFYGITIVMITHDMDVVKRVCRRVVVMDAGHLLEDMPLAAVFEYPTSQARQMLYQRLAPELPACLTAKLSAKPNDRPLLRLFFQGESANIPFISQISRDLALNINILLANIDRFDTVTCGVLVVELLADPERLQAFITRCVQVNLSVEVLGYVTEFMA